MKSHLAGQSETRLGITLQTIANDVVHALGFVGALVATCDEKGVVSWRAVHVDPAASTPAQRARWLDQLSPFLNPPLKSNSEGDTSRLDLDRASLGIHEAACQANLAVQVIQQRQAVRTSALAAVSAAVLPDAGQALIAGEIQPALQIRQVIGVPVFVATGGGAPAAVAGVVMAARTGEISRQDERVLTAFARQAAAALEIEQQRLKVLRVARQLTTEIQARISHEGAILDQIVRGVVEVLGYTGAMLATYEKADNSLPLRAVYFDPALEIEKWEDRIVQLMRRPIRITEPDPRLARVYVHDQAYRHNLSVQAVRARRPVVSDDLYMLFTPFVPAASRPVFKLIQRTVGIRQVIAVPFFLATPADGDPEIVGNLFAATTRADGFQAEEIELLQAFGQQAAAGIRNARLLNEVAQLYDQARQQQASIEELYRKAQERREVAELFGKMAFSAAANVHTLRNHLGAFSAHLQLMVMYRHDAEKLATLLEAGPRYVRRLQDAAAILDSLHEPWQRQWDEAVNVNESLREALRSVNDRLNLGERIRLEQSLAEDLPPVYTSFEMFTEAAKILMKNGMEAILARHGVTAETPPDRMPDPPLGVLRVESRLVNEETLEILIQDTGTGIPGEHLPRIFDLHWSTKEAGMGFGLFWLKDYVEGLGGRVWVESRSGEGTQFHVLVPVLFPHVDGTGPLPAQGA